MRSKYNSEATCSWARLHRQRHQLPPAIVVAVRCFGKRGGITAIRLCVGSFVLSPRSRKRIMLASSDTVLSRDNQNRTNIHPATTPTPYLQARGRGGEVAPNKLRRNAGRSEAHSGRRERPPLAGRKPAAIGRRQASYRSIDPPSPLSLHVCYLSVTPILNMMLLQHQVFLRFVLEGSFYSAMRSLESSSW